MPRPTISVVTPSYNQAHFLEWTVRSVVCQDYPHVEYVVMDAESTDGSQDLLRRYADAIDVLVIAKDQGQSDALNRGFRKTAGDVLGYLNSDDCYAHAGVLSQVAAAFEANPDADVIYGQRDLMNADGTYFTSWPFRAFDRGRFVRADFIPQEATFWRRSAYERAGGFINQAFDFAMDYELFLRMMDAGATFLSVPDVWGLFRYYPDQKSNAWWQTKGLPEIQRLQAKYLDRPFEERLMQDAYGEHMYGASNERHPDAHRAFWTFWNGFQQAKTAALNGRRLDGWVAHAPVNPARARSKAA